MRSGASAQPAHTPAQPAPRRTGLLCALIDQDSDFFWPLLRLWLTKNIWVHLILKKKDEDG